MPTYEYKCIACDHAFERFQSITADPVRKCPECGKSKVKRLLGIGAGLIFKGSGFYITDYRSESYKNSAKSESPAGASAGASDKSKSTGDNASASADRSAQKPAASAGPGTKAKKP